MRLSEKIRNYLKLIVYSVYKFVKMFFKSIFTLKKCFDLIVGILYQPIIFCITWKIIYILDTKIKPWIDKEFIVHYVIMLVILMLIIVLFLNAIIELIYCLCHKKEQYDIIFSIQKGFYNYALIIISLIAFWIAYDKSIDNIVNLKLLIMGCVFFLCVIVTDLYNFLIHEPNKILEVYKDILQKKKELLGN